MELPTLVAGLRFLRGGSYDSYCVMPPLVPVTAAIPALFSNAHIPLHDRDGYKWLRREYDFARAFAVLNGTKTGVLLEHGRFACFVFTIIGAVGCFAWAKKLLGAASGVVAAFLWCGCPLIIGYASQISSDLAAAALGVTAMYSFSNWLEHRSITTASIFSILFGIAQLTKFTLLALLPVCAILVFCVIFIERRSARFVIQRVWQLSVAISLICITINIGYAFRGSCTRLGDFHFASALLSSSAADRSQKRFEDNRFRSRVIGTLVVPLPEAYIIGIDTQLYDLENVSGAKRSYLAGVWAGHGWPYYYAYGLLTRLQCGTLLLCGVALYFACWLGVRGMLLSELTVILSFGAILCAVSCETGFNQHFRYAIPTVPFLFVTISRCAARSQQKWGCICCLTCLLGNVAETAVTFPHAHGFFNCVSGGMRDGHRHMLHSSTDAGEDLYFLRDWMELHPIATRIVIVHESSVPLGSLGFDLDRVLPSDYFRRRYLVQSGDEMHPRRGWYALSVNNVFGEKKCYSYFREVEPVELIGSSIYVYYVE